MRIFLSATETAPDKKAAISAIMNGGGMKIFLSAVETGAPKAAVEKMLQPPPCMLWNLMSYYYLRSDVPFAERVRERSEMIMIDSGAHSFQKGVRVDWEKYTHEYAAFIKQFDRPNVVGYFEMDVDNITGYENVLKLRRILETESGCSEKIIPVWHKNRGIDGFKKMCQTHAGRVVAITGFKNEDIKDHQYPAFLRYAHSKGCKVHCLGMTRKKILDKVPFDYTDSSTWAQEAIYGKVGNRKVSREFSKTNRTDVFLASYKNAMRMQLWYHAKWRKVSND